MKLGDTWVIIGLWNWAGGDLVDWSNRKRLTRHLR